MKCLCGADMRHQSMGVWFCSKGDRFAVRLLGPTGSEVQWYMTDGEVVPYPPMPTDVAEGKMKLDAWISGNR